MSNNISVIIPTYNSSLYIVRTLDSVLSQSCLPHEIVIVDDGSTDNTIEIIEDYKKNNESIFDNIRLYKQKNMGAGAARNRAILEAKGQWIAFLDSDDIWLPTKLEEVEKVINNSPQISIIAHDEFAVNDKKMDKRRLCNLHELFNESKDLFLQLYEGNIFSTSCMVIKKDVIERAGGFDVSLRSAQDYDLWIRCSIYGKLVYIPKALEIYVTRDGNISANIYRRYVCEMNICHKYIGELTERIGVNRAQAIVRQRIFNIHKVEAYLALKQRKFSVFAKIMLRLIPEIIKGVK